MSLPFRAASIRRLAGGPIILGLVILSSSAIYAQHGNHGFRQAVGGVVVDGQGVLRKAGSVEMAGLRELRVEVLQGLPDDLKQSTNLRFVSLRRLNDEIAKRRELIKMPMVTPEMEYLGGLTRIKYVFVYPEEHDIVLAGPAEAIKCDAQGNMVGAVSGAPTLTLTNLLMALRTARSAARNPITCSIDPTPEGIQALQRFLRTQSTFGPNTVAGVERAMGLQKITVTGVPPRSEFARTLVAADFQMKRLGMAIDRSPLKAVPSYLSLLSSTSTGLQSATPRWWMAPNYEPLHKDPEGLAWELRGPGVRVMTEDAFITETGAKPNGKASRAATLWAERMTENFDALSKHFPIFGDLRNAMDMAVIGALLVKENLPGKAGLEMPLLMNDDGVAIEQEFPVPQKVNTIGSVIKKGRRYIISASGGVDLNSWQVVQKIESDTALTPIRKKSAYGGGKWWWD